MARGGGDYRQRLTAAFVQAVEEHDGLPWDNGFDAIAARPFNPVRGVRYRGGNVVHLLLKQLEMGSDDPRWMTLNQANEAGYSVRKGAKATYVEYWDFGRKDEAPKVDEKGNPIEDTKQDRAAEAEQEERRKPKVFFAQVFNGADVVGLPPLKRELGWAPSEAAERLIAACGADIEHRVISRVGGGVIDNAAYYDPRSDKIVLPPREQFRTEGDYYATVLHELAHWTAHPLRLGRDLPAEAVQRGTAEYAREELRAEIAAMYLTAMLGVEGTAQNHARYAAHWVEQLKADKHELFRAARDAEKIVDHLLDHAPELRQQVEATLGQNVLEKGQGQRAKAAGIVGELPNFVPADAKPEVVRTGRDDPRWQVFEDTLRSQALRWGIDMAVVDNALRLVEGHFTPVMEQAKKNGYGSEEMREMLIRNIVDEMRTADKRQQAWTRFADQVRERADGSVTPSQLDAALKDLGAKYQTLIGTAVADKWPHEKTDAAIVALVYGEDGRRPVDAAFVRELVEKSPAAAALREDETVLSPVGSQLGLEDDEDDLVLTPIGSDESPEEVGAIAEEPIRGFVLDDAEVHP